MRIKYVGSQNFILALVIGMLLGWVFGASAAEKWDAKTTARVNLRRNPSSNGVILSIVPKGYRVRIMEKQGLWCKIDVEGDIHGKGWVYSEYIEEILSKVPESETNLQTATAEMPTGERIERIHPANLTPSVKTPDEKQTQLHTPVPEKDPWKDVMEQPPSYEEFLSGSDKLGTESQVKIPTADEFPQTAPAQELSEMLIEDEKEKPLGTIKSVKVPVIGSKQHSSTQNELQGMQSESSAAPPMESLIIGKAIHVAPVQPPQSGTKGHSTGMIKKTISEIPVQGDSNAKLLDFPVEKKAPATTGQPKSLESLEIKKGAVSNTPAVIETAKQGIGVSYKRMSTANHESMGLVELLLKLMSITLTALVILYLHRANKIAASHHEALMQFQNRLNSQP